MNAEEKLARANALKNLLSQTEGTLGNLEYTRDGKHYSHGDNLRLSSNDPTVKKFAWKFIELNRQMRNEWKNELQELFK